MHDRKMKTSFNKFKNIIVEDIINQLEETKLFSDSIKPK